MRGGQREASGGRRMIDLEWMEAIAGWEGSFENGPQLGEIIFKLGEINCRVRSNLSGFNLISSQF